MIVFLTLFFLTIPSLIHSMNQGNPTAQTAYADSVMIISAAVHVARKVFQAYPVEYNPYRALNYSQHLELLVNCARNTINTNNGDTSSTNPIVVQLKGQQYSSALRTIAEMLRSNADQKSRVTQCTDLPNLVSHLGLLAELLVTIDEDFKRCLPNPIHVSHKL